MMNTYLLQPLISASLWLLIVSGWLVLLADAAGLVERLGQVGVWVVFLLVSCLLPVALWWTFGPAPR
jgi:hypothetical protein